MKNMETTLEPAALSITDTGRYLSVSVDTVRRLIRDGKLPHARIGNSIRVRRTDVDAFLNEQTSRQWHPVDGRGRKTGGTQAS
jgi:excisionase family DNA binding protein